MLCQQKNRHSRGLALGSYGPGLIGRNALIFDIAPGTVYPDLDIHAPGAEEVFVVSDTFCDGKNIYPARTFIHPPPPRALRTYRSQPMAAC